MHIELFLPAAVVAVFMAVAMGMDLKTRRIPNWLTVTTFALGLVYHTIIDGWIGLGTALGGFALGFGLLMLLWLIGAGGGGDVKMMGALGAWLGPTQVLIVFVVSGLVALGLVILIFVWKMIARSTSNRGPTPPGPRRQWASARFLIPYAVPAALSTWIVLALHLASGIQ